MRKFVRRLWFCLCLLSILAGALYIYVYVPPQEQARIFAPQPATNLDLPQATPTGVRDFSEAKKIAAVLYQDHPYTFYCGCRFSGKQVDHGACGYKPIHDTTRAHRLEWEHIVPAHAFGQAFTQWKKGAAKCVHTSGKPYHGRACARVASKAFSQMEADLYNLVPAIGEVNQLRADFPMGLLPGVAPMFGKCRTKIFHGVIEPREEVRGFVARTYKYMDAHYPGFSLITNANRAMFEKWDRDYPADAFEIWRAKKIASIQGNANPFVSP